MITWGHRASHSAIHPSIYSPTHPPPHTHTQQTLRLEGIFPPPDPSSYHHHHHHHQHGGDALASALAAGLSQRQGQRLDMLALGDNALPALTWRRLLRAAGVGSPPHDGGMWRHGICMYMCLYACTYIIVTVSASNPPPHTRTAAAPLPPRSLGLRDIAILLPPPPAPSAPPPDDEMDVVDNAGEGRGIDDDDATAAASLLLQSLASAVATAAEDGLASLEFSYRASFTAGGRVDPLPPPPTPVFRALALATGLRRLDLTTAGRGPWLSVEDATEVRPPAWAVGRLDGWVENKKPHTHGVLIDTHNSPP